MMSSSRKGERVSQILTDFLGIGQDVVGALTGFPYVGPIFQAIEKIAQIRDEVNANKGRGAQLLQLVQDDARILIDRLDKLRKSRHADRLRNIQEDLRQFELILVSIFETLSESTLKRKRDRFRQILDRTQIKEDIESCERKLQGFHQRFTMGTLLEILFSVFETSDLSSRRQVLTQLPYAERASWNRDLCCLAGTRQDLLQDIYNWFSPSLEPSTIPTTTRIFWLQGPAGSGKSAVAHSVATWAADQGIFVPSFFLTPGTTPSLVSSNQGVAIQLPSTYNLISTLLYDLSKYCPSFGDAIAEELHNGRYLLSDPHRQFTEIFVRYAHLLDTSKPVLWVIDGFDELRRIDDDSGGFSTRDILRLWESEVPKLPNHFLMFVTSRPLVDRILSRPPAHLHSSIIDLASPASRRDVELIARARIAHLAEEKGLCSWPDETTLSQFIWRAGGLPLWITVVTNFLRNSLRPQDDLKQILSSDVDHDHNIDTDLTNDMEKIYTRVLEACAVWERKEHKRLLGEVLGILLALRRPLSVQSLCALCKDGSLSHTLPPIINTLRPVLIGVDDGAPIEFIHLSFRDFLVSPSQKIVQIDQPSGHATLALCCFLRLNTDLDVSAESLSWEDHEGNPNPPFPGHPDPSTSLVYSSAHIMEHLSYLDAGASDKLQIPATQFLSSTLLRWMEFQACFGEYCSVRCVRKRAKVLNMKAMQIDGWTTRGEVIQATRNIEFWLHSVGRLEESLEARMDSTIIFRRLAIQSPQDFNPELAGSLNNLSNRFSDVGSRDEALAAIQEAVKIHRQLATERPQAYNPDLALSLNNLTSCLAKVGSREEALTAIQEAVEIRRQLATEDPRAFNPDLAMSLNNLSSCLSEVGSRDEALPAIQESVEIYRQLATERPQAYNPDLAMSLNNLSLHLSDVGSREEALTAIQEAVEIRRQLATEHPQVFNPDISRSLNNLSLRLFEVGSREEALTAIQEAVEIHRQLATEHPQAFNPDLAMSLNNLSLRLSDVDSPEEALTAIQEAVEIRRQLATERPQAFNPDLAMSLNNLSNRFSNIGSQDKALTAIQEAVKINRQLTTEHPRAFNYNLATSLYNLSDCLDKLEQCDEALLAITEALALYKRLATERPLVFKSDVEDCLNLLSHIRERLTMHGKEDTSLSRSSDSEM